ncbi:hypothetical protein GT755_15705 [Herbidospora sp. NEAU-GS84]|uniref:Uncharacterized protein n=1 Tax=Herbidospora solisilvae TaxID=2696284 RepID=A0A7C9NI28_9ACTN|nr:hypothetical protein [Herbidospora solisilvae]NAS23132.1 hypothetical protein [Herbidospora solisilvae]
MAGLTVVAQPNGHGAAGGLDGEVLLRTRLRRGGRPPGRWCPTRPAASPSPTSRPASGRRRDPHGTFRGDYPVPA